MGCHGCNKMGQRGEDWRRGNREHTSWDHTAVWNGPEVGDLQGTEWA